MQMLNYFTFSFSLKDGGSGKSLEKEEIWLHFIQNDFQIMVIMYMSLHRLFF